eukprot:Lithocolla_globosa_v1_NODE_723_length_3383_cov_3.240986.p1 type:complete len:404 gc:universal NODE_723_length_3383_cov_3.240986:1852-3063(+)
MNAAITNADIPMPWVQGIITAIPKPGGNMAFLGDYRPITLLDTTAKLLEKIFLARFTGKLNRVISELQAGFTKGRGCAEDLFCLEEIIAQAKENHHRPLHAVFLDLRRAFDSVWHDGLFTKLWAIGITGQAWSLFRHWYERVESAVKTGKRTDTGFFPVMTGVRQGGVLSPYFFVLFLNDLLDNLSNVKVDGQLAGYFIAGRSVAALALADDVVLLASSPRAAQALLDEAAKFAKKWQLFFKASKCKYMAFSKDHLPHVRPQLQLDCIAIEEVARYKYLGFWFSSQSHHHLSIGISTKVAAGKGVLDQILPLIPAGTDKYTRLVAYMEHVRSAMEYGLEALNLSVDQLTSLQAAEGDILAEIASDLPWESLSARTTRRRVVFLEKMLAAPPHTLRYALASQYC